MPGDAHRLGEVAQADGEGPVAQGDFKGLADLAKNLGEAIKQLSEQFKGDLKAASSGAGPGGAAGAGAASVVLGRTRENGVIVVVGRSHT